MKILANKNILALTLLSLCSSSAVLAQGNGYGDSGYGSQPTTQPYGQPQYPTGSARYSRSPMPLGSSSPMPYGSGTGYGTQPVQGWRPGSQNSRSHSYGYSQRRQQGLGNGYSGTTQPYNGGYDNPQTGYGNSGNGYAGSTSGYDNLPSGYGQPDYSSGYDNLNGGYGTPTAAKSSSGNSSGGSPSYLYRTKGQVPLPAASSGGYGGSGSYGGSSRPQSAEGKAAELAFRAKLMQGMFGFFGPMGPTGMFGYKSDPAWNAAAKAREDAGYAKQNADNAAAKAKSDLYYDQQAARQRAFNDGNQRALNGFNGGSSATSADKYKYGWRDY
jgi:hypothetical protein